MNNKYNYNHIRLGTMAWLGAIILGIVTWYGIGYGMYTLYNHYHPSKKIEFRYSLGLLKQ